MVMASFLGTGAPGFAGLAGDCRNGPALVALERWLEGGSGDWDLPDFAIGISSQFIKRTFAERGHSLRFREISQGIRLKLLFPQSSWFAIRLRRGGGAVLAHKAAESSTASSGKGQRERNQDYPFRSPTIFLDSLGSQLLRQTFEAADG
jgi:hypothetical protein